MISNKIELLPREKMEQYGAKSLSNEELLALILGSGTRDCDVFKLSHRISEYLSNAAEVPSIDALRDIQGLGRVKATKILACLELSARYILSEKSVSICTPEDLVKRISYLKFEKQEHLILICLNAANIITNVHELTKGLVNQTPVHPREAFVKAIENHAVSVIFAHNHPSGNITPSHEDLSVTRTLCAAGKIIQIPVVDHIIVGKRGFTSICREYPEIFRS